ncbi:MAG: type IV pilus twitching motility protein PilT [Lachnospiraceae bacterium]|nr:type IV pilus twitching motility protein PilT [Lachnospiraceae bacterium]MDE6186047.1 type IV pilus twitching motility protein PilT [Lachnospiraceae bacterium]MDE7286701.1 type IV pilus twitching motility protein PilT [Lachnospiraceae bacterium]
MPTIEEMLRIAKTAGASDVHVTVGIPPKMRVNGKLITMEFDRLMPNETLQMLSEIMNEEQRRRFEERGEYDMSFSIPNMGRYRVNAYKQRGSVAIALRLVGTHVPSPEELGVPDTVINLYEKKRGLVLVTGPTGSGKSTTLAAIIDKINNNRECHVITLEDPIEYLHQHKLSIVNQREIGLDTQTYANALRAALREDPDVILVGEMRDFETISVAITAAETGHLVLSTLHTLGAASTVDRVIDVFPAHQQQQIRVQFANVLEAVVSQQLIPRKDEEGRIAAFEVLHANQAVRNLIREGKSHQLKTVMQTNRKLGMITMDETIAQLYTDGKISKEMAIQFAQDSDGIKNKLL